MLSLGMPIPVSVTDISNSHWVAPSTSVRFGGQKLLLFTFTSIVISPCSVNLLALLSRLRRIWQNRCLSPMRYRGTSEWTSTLSFRSFCFCMLGNRSTVCEICRCKSNRFFCKGNVRQELGGTHEGEGRGGGEGTTPVKQCSLLQSWRSQGSC